MKLLSLTPILLALAAPVFATTITLSGTDPFAPGDNCNSPACDVIGDRAEFDIQKGAVVIDTGTASATADLFFNFGPNNTSLTPFTISGLSPTFYPGDLLFSVGGVYTYAIPLVSHGDLTAGDLYAINTPANTITAQQALGNPSGAIYRNDLVVWAPDQNAADVTLINAGGVNVTGGGDGNLNPKFDVTLNFTPNSAFLTDAGSGNMTFQFSSAICGNDVLYGNQFTSSVPEPGTLALMGSALLGLALLRPRKKA